MNLNGRQMTRAAIAILLFAVVLTPELASAKRGPVPKVDPVDYQGVRYLSQLEGHRHYILATDIKSGGALWEATIYRTYIIPFMEEDVQWVFIKEIFIDQGELIVVAEDGQGYGVDLQTHAVVKLKQVPKKPEAGNAAGGHAVEGIKP